MSRFGKSATVQVRLRLATASHLAPRCPRPAVCKSAMTIAPFSRRVSNRVSDGEEANFCITTALVESQTDKCTNCWPMNCVLKEFVGKF